ncbi:MAG: M23 family metallopeptidase [Clostridia bacterium]|nr:M23 family metallopeptidase [Clostridia bacterium]
MENHETKNTNVSRIQKLKQKALSFLKAKGYYVAMFLCLGALGTAAALSLVPAKEEPSREPAPTPTAEPAGSMQEERLADKLLPTPTPVPTPTPTPIPDFTPAPTAPAPRVEKAPAPVEGTVVWKFAMDSLLYSKTLDQWTTHSGIDIACKRGAEVASILPGTVEEVYEDARLGYTVVLSHSEKRRTVYANLAEDIPVKAGDKVKAGEVIGKVGDTSVTECGEETHLHFEFIVNNAFVDPVDYILIGE